MSVLVKRSITDHSEGISVVIDINRESVVPVVESLMLVPRAWIECGRVELRRCFVQVRLNLIEVVPDDSLELSAGDKYQELWFNSAIEVELDFWQ